MAVVMDCEILNGVCGRCGKPGRDGVRRNCDGTPGLGDLVQRRLAAIGITQEKVARITGRPCGCANRKAALNRLGRKITGWISRTRTE